MKFTSGDKNLGDNVTQAVIDNIIQAVMVATNQALFQSGVKEINKLAKRQGFLRETIERSLMNQIASQAGQTRIKITLNKNQLTSMLDYIKDHWNRPPYRNPTTPGTQPIYPLVIMNTIKGNVKWRLITQFEGARFKVTVN